MTYWKVRSEEYYEDEPDHMRCRWCGRCYFPDNHGEAEDCHRLSYGTNCTECRRSHLQSLVEKWSYKHRWVDVQYQSWDVRKCAYCGTEMPLDPPDWWQPPRCVHAPRDRSTRRD